MTKYRKVYVLPQIRCFPSIRCWKAHAAFSFLHSFSLHREKCFSWSDYDSDKVSGIEQENIKDLKGLVMNFSNFIETAIYLLYGSKIYHGTKSKITTRRADVIKQQRDIKSIIVINRHYNCLFSLWPMTIDQYWTNCVRRPDLQLSTTIHSQFSSIVQFPCVREDFQKLSGCKISIIIFVCILSFTNSQIIFLATLFLPFFCITLPAPSYSFL